MIIKYDCRLLAYLLIVSVTAALFTGCGKKNIETKAEQETVISETAEFSAALEKTENTSGAVTGNAATEQMAELNGKLTLNMPDDKYRTCYEVFVYAFADSNGDGIGDLQGLISKLDVINDGDPKTDGDLGYNEIWLMPICPSPTYHKYDVTDYMAIDTAYGTMEDFDLLISECHKRGVNVILDTVINHTSSEHPWFLEASKYIKSLGTNEEPDVNACPYVDYYRFSRTKEEGYEPLPGSSWFYEARFWSGMPDLNLQNESVRSEIETMIAFWIEHGADGFRMDAVTSYETGDHEANIEVLSWFHDMVTSKDPDSYIVGECWTGSGTYSQYYRSGCDSFFDFDFSGSEGVIAKTVLGSRKASSYGEALMKEEELYASENPAYINAPFYTNHDMARSAGYYAKD
ncbi:MAG: alpha-amylase, partial [Lachnospiraceae bacterium]|nr:alpha-amylase [Lachnospiraceae bacterium]